MFPISNEMNSSIIRLGLGTAETYPIYVLPFSLVNGYISVILTANWTDIHQSCWQIGEWMKDETRKNKI